MQQEALGHLQINTLVDEVITELNRRLEMEQNRANNRRKTFVLGSLKKEEEKALCSFSQVMSSPKDESWDLVVAAELSIKAMVQAALGIPGEPAADCILQSLLRGKKVYILERGLEYRRFCQTSYKTLYQTYQEYETVLRRFGCEIISDIFDAAGGKRKSCQKGGTEDWKTGDILDLTGKRLLGEMDLSGVRKAGYASVLIDKSAIITPLAQDFISNHNLSVRRK